MPRDQQCKAREPSLCKCYHALVSASNACHGLVPRDRCFLPRATTRLLQRTFNHNMRPQTLDLRSCTSPQIPFADSSIKSHLPVSSRKERIVAYKIEATLVLASCCKGQSPESHGLTIFRPTFRPINLQARLNEPNFRKLSRQTECAMPIRATLLPPANLKAAKKQRARLLKHGNIQSREDIPS